MRKRLLIVDGMNIYMRCYNANPATSTNGDPIGGCMGFLTSLQKICRNIDEESSAISEIVVIWDGVGGSARKRKMNKAYKKGRKPVRLNRLVRGLLTEAQEQANRAWQFDNTIDYVGFLPIHQIRIDDFEADDIISYVNSLPQYENYDKIIVSTDKDFYQCTYSDENGKTVLYRPKQGGEFEIVGKNSILEQYGIHPINFAIARAIEGDKSDNLTGVPGVGLKTLAKRFPWLANEQEYMVQDIVEECQKNLGKIKMYGNIIEYKDLILANYQIMQLSMPNLSPQATKSIRNLLRSEKNFNKTAIIAMMIKDGFGSFDWNTLFAIAKRLKSPTSSTTTPSTSPSS